MIATDLEREESHKLKHLGCKSSSLRVVGLISRYHPGKDVVGDYIASIVRKFGARAFHVGEVIFDSFVVRLQPLRHSSIESITHFCSRIIHRKMADYVIL